MVLHSGQFITKLEEQLQKNNHFLFHYELKKGLLLINIQKFGNPKLFKGVNASDVPIYHRITFNMILGMNNKKQSALILDNLNLMLNVKTKYKTCLQ